MDEKFICAKCHVEYDISELNLVHGRCIQRTINGNNYREAEILVCSNCYKELYSVKDITIQIGI